MAATYKKNGFFQNLIFYGVVDWLFEEGMANRNT
jgi:hypothetical protein